MLVLDVAHSDFPPKHDVLWSIFPKPQVQYMSIWGFLPYPSIWTHHDTPVFAKTRGCGPITCCPSAGVGTPPLHKPVSSDGRFGGTKRANPQGMGSIPMMNLFFGGGMNIRLPGKTLRVQQKISGYVFTNAYDFWKAWLHAFWEKYRQSPFLFNSGPRRPSCWIASGFIRIQLSRDCCNPSSSALQSWI